VIATDAYDLTAIDDLNTVAAVRVVKNHNGTDTKKCGKYIDAVKGNPPQILGHEVEDNGSLGGGWTQADIDKDCVKFVNPIVASEVNSGSQIAVWTNPGDNGGATIPITVVESVDPITITDSEGRPDKLPLGLVRFKVAVPNPGDEAVVTLFLPAELPENAGWYKYDSTFGWQDYTAMDCGLTKCAIFIDRRTVRLRLRDGAPEAGGLGDADLTVNGVIVDPGGPGITIAQADVLSISGSGADTAAAGGCFLGSLVNR
jgi:hypothetical protein